MKWVIVEMTWAYDDVETIRVLGTFDTESDAMVAMEQRQREPGVSYTIRPIQSF